MAFTALQMECRGQASRPKPSGKRACQNHRRPRAGHRCVELHSRDLHAVQRTPDAGECVWTSPTGGKAALQLVFLQANDLQLEECVGRPLSWQTAAQLIHLECQIPAAGSKTSACDFGRWTSGSDDFCCSGPLSSTLVFTCKWLVHWHDWLKGMLLDLDRQIAGSREIGKACAPVGW